MIFGPKSPGKRNFLAVVRRFASAALVGITVAAAHGAEPVTPNPGLHYYYAVPAVNPPQTIRVDVCVYGGTPAGVGAAVQAGQMGKTTALAVFRRHVGGMTTGGLTAVDTGKAASIGGMTTEFLLRSSGSKAASLDGSPELGFRPSQAERIFRAMLEEAGVSVYLEHRLKSVTRDGQRITALTFENGNRIEAKVFVDATYEGDLFAMAGVSYHVGREDNSTYGETVNGFLSGVSSIRSKQGVFLFFSEGWICA